MIKINIIIFCLLFFFVNLSSGKSVLFSIGKKDGSSAEFDGYSEGFKGYVKRLGDRDKIFMVGFHSPSERWTYILPGKYGKWAGMGYWSWRVNFTSFACLLDKKPEKNCQLRVCLAKVAKNAPVLRLEVNGYREDIDLKKRTKKNQVSFTIPTQFLEKGGNVFRLHIISGDWLEFDAVEFLSGDPSLQLLPPRDYVVESLSFSKKEYSADPKKKSRQQALIIDVVNQKSTPRSLDIWVDGKKVQSHFFPAGRQSWEVMLPTVKKATSRIVRVSDEKGIVAERKLIQSPGSLAQWVDEVNMFAGTCNSRWMFTPGPTAPLALMRLSPENEPSRWKSGYDYQIESICGFSHIHEWTMSGLLTMPYYGKDVIVPGDPAHPDSGWRSRIDPRESVAGIAKYSVTLKDTGIRAEMSATRRASLEKYTFPACRAPRIIFSLQTGVDEYKTYINEVHLQLVNEYEIRGFSRQLNKGSGYPERQNYTVYFVLQFDKPIRRLDAWKNDTLIKDIEKLSYKRPEKQLGKCGFIPVFKLPDTGGVVKVRTGISLVDIEGAVNNLNREIEKPFGWSLKKLVNHQRGVWEKLLGRICVKTHDRTRRSRFYTCLYRSLSGRGICSDCDGRWRDAEEKIQKTSNALGMFSSDAVWGSHWNFNQLWNWVYPEFSKCFMDSQVQYFEKTGFTLKGPAGGEAIGVMLGSPEIPFIAGAWTAGVRPFNAKKLWKAVYHQQTTPGIFLPCGGFAGNEHYADYLKYGYIPAETKGYANYSSSTLEYAYQDWAAGQLAIEMNRPSKEVNLFSERSHNWKNAIHPEKHIVLFKNKSGQWTSKTHCVEGGPTQLRWFVPQDINGLAQYLGGAKKVADILNRDFASSESMNFMAPADQMTAIKINHGNQPMMHASYLFNAIGFPKLSQKWVRSILDRYYGYTPYDAYLGDEDQGQMSAWLNMASMGIFSIDGGVGTHSVAELIPPSFEEIKVSRPLGADWIIRATSDVARSGRAKKVFVNGVSQPRFRIPLKQLLAPSKKVILLQWK